MEFNYIVFRDAYLYLLPLGILLSHQSPQELVPSVTDSSFDSIRSNSLNPRSGRYIHKGNRLFNAMRLRKINIGSCRHFYGHKLGHPVCGVGNRDFLLDFICLCENIEDQTLIPLEEWEIQDELMCAVCQQVMIPEQPISKIRRCPHFFHTECIENWISIKDQCPVCRIII